jgi:hypothetical protein
MGAENTSPGELAKWMQSEHQALQELNKLIRQHIADMPDINRAEWLHGLKVAYERLWTHLKRHFAAKQENGYLRMVVEMRPTLSRQVEHIRREHDEILHMAARILHDLSEVMPEHRLLIADLCARIQRFMAVVADHEQREVMITMYVFSQDIGAKD